jgi:hypothetical protein
MNQWRIGQDGKAHLIIGCDPGASAWVAVCRAMITGPAASKACICCHKCMSKVEEMNEKTAEEFANDLPKVQIR